MLWPRESRISRTASTCYSSDNNIVVKSGDSRVHEHAPVAYRLGLPLVKLHSRCPGAFRNDGLPLYSTFQLPGKNGQPPKLAPVFACVTGAMNAP